MGKPSRPPPPPYQDEPTNSDAVSMHTTPDDYEYNDPPGAAELPSYEESVQAGPDTESFRPGEDEFSSIAEPDTIRFGTSGVVHNKNTGAPRVGPSTSIRMDERLNDPIELEKYVEQYLAYMPLDPCVRIQGTHWETKRRDNKTTKERVLDFDIIFSLKEYLADHRQKTFWKPSVVSNSRKVHRGSWRATRAPGVTQDIQVGDEESPSLHEWCQDFCNSKAVLKVFRVSRELSGFDQGQIRTSVSNAIRATHYRGHIEVSFPTVDKNVDIYNPHWINQARISWVRWIFYLTFLWLITWPLLFLFTMRWNVYHVEWVWSFTNPPPNNSIRWVWRMSETMWANSKTNLIKKLAVERFQGHATQLDAGSVDGQAWQRSMNPTTGNASIDGAAHLVRGGIDVWNSLNGRSTPRGLNNSAGQGWGFDIEA